MHDFSRFMNFFHFHFKKGMEEEGFRFLETEFVKKSKNFGCKGFDLFQSENDAFYFVGVGLWDSKEDAHKFQSFWQAKEKEFGHFFAQFPKVECFKTKDVFGGGKFRKTA